MHEVLGYFRDCPDYSGERELAIRVEPTKRSSSRYVAIGADFHPPVGFRNLRVNRRYTGIRIVVVLIRVDNRYYSHFGVLNDYVDSLISVRLCVLKRFYGVFNY